MLRKRLASGLCCGIVGLGACTTLRRIEPAALLANDGPAIVWVTRTNNTVVQVIEPIVKRDTLRGKLNGARVRIPLSEVQAVRAKLPDHTKTALLAAGLGVTTLSVLYVGFISQAGSHSAGINCGLDALGDQLLDC